MTLRDSIEADSLKVFLNLNEFAETVTYHPHRAFGQPPRAPRSIKAVVIREDMLTLGEDDGQTVVPQFTVHVKNSSTEGISSTEIDLGADQLEFPRRDGKPPEKRTVLRMTDQDHGMLVLQCH